MIKRLLCFAVVSMLVWASVPAGAEEGPDRKIVMIPFSIVAGEDLHYLSRKIPEMMAGSLEAEGAAVVVDRPLSAPDADALFSGSTEIADLRRSELHADHVIWGRMTYSGSGVDLEVFERRKDSDETRSFSESGDGIEALFAMVGRIGSRMSQTLFLNARVLGIDIAGNKRIESDAIRGVMKTRTGGIYRKAVLSDDLKRIYSLGFGYFEDIRMETEDRDGGVWVTVTVREKPTIRKIEIHVSRVYQPEEISEELTIEEGAVLNVARINENIRRIEALFVKKNYHHAEVTYRVEPVDDNLVDLEFDIEPGEKVYVTEIRFEGNQNIPEKELKKNIDSNEKWFMSWLTGAGEFNRDMLIQDSMRLNAYYMNNGYAKARVSEPQIDMVEDEVHVIFKIDEGMRYTIGTVGFEGDMAYPEEVLSAALETKPEMLFSRESLQKDLTAITDMYENLGYANADIYPLVRHDDEKRISDITYAIKKGNPVYFDRIYITGNTKTRDKVIRRQMMVMEQSLYSGAALKRSVRNLTRLDYFEDVKVNTTPGDRPDTVNLEVAVREKPTGAFTFGAGYSSEEGLFGQVAINQRNLFGRGQTMNLQAEVGGSTTRYTLSFTEPWLFDTPLSAGFDLYNWEKEYDTYNKEAVGLSLRLGYPVWDYTRIYIAYNIENADITDVDSGASDDILLMEGENLISSVTTSLTYDSRNRAINASEGNESTFSVEYAGGFLGGDIAYNKYLTETGWYFPLFKRLTLFLHGRAGFIGERDDGIIPDYKKFYLGGINSVRGYGWQDIYALDEDDKTIGGNKFVQGNVELLLTAVESAGLVLVGFYDTGDVFGKDENIGFGRLKYSAGYGLRWYSPMGPIRLEYGIILDDEYGSRGEGRWEFAMGAAF